MTFDPENHVVKLCVQGMFLEGEGKPDDAKQKFSEAWESATAPIEKCIAAHYVARHQKSAVDKLRWDELALRTALEVDDSFSKSALPSLYLNVAKCHEDLGDFENARLNYTEAQRYFQFLPNDGYDQMVVSGVLNGIHRVNAIPKV